jgi:hypothetical protein
VEKISGSVGRFPEFDQIFMPLKRSAEVRWKRVDRAFRRDEELPAVSLFQVGSIYFVLDGHHRISVARFHGVEWIDADVTELRATSMERSNEQRGVDRGVRGRRNEDARDDGFGACKAAWRVDAARSSDESQGQRAAGNP